MALTLTVAGVDRTNKILDLEVQVYLWYTEYLNARNTLRVTFRDVIGGFKPADGQEIILLENGTRRFAGILEEPEEAVITDTNWMLFTCSAVDFASICDRHLVARVYENQTLKQIVEDIVAQDLASEGITTGGVETGPTFTKVVFNYEPATKVFNELSDLSGYAWWIDKNKALQFRARTSILAATSLTTANIIDGTTRVKPRRERYRNKQLLRAGVDLTDLRTESFKGDGTRRTFNLDFPVGKVPTSITVNGGAPKTIGIRGVDTGKQYYWNKGATEIGQDTSETILTTADTLAVTYQGQFPIIVSAQLDAEITARAAVEGGSGVYEGIDNDPNIDSDDVALDKANALLMRYGSIGKVVICETDTSGYEAGQLVTVILNDHAISGTFLIDEVDVAPLPGLERLRYRITALEGDSFGGWQAFFRKLTDVGRDFVIRDNEVLLLLRTNSDDVYCHDVLNALSAAAENRVDYARVGFSEIGA